MLNNFLKYKESNGIAYLLNPKVACTTIQNSLLEGKIDNVHAIENFPSYYDISAPIFTVVRNPFTRTVSAYLDKVKSKKDLVVWKSFCDSINIDCSYDISFDEYLDVLTNHPDLKTADKHFRPQVDNFHGIKPSFIGYMEDMKSVEKFLLVFGVQLLNKAPHKTNTESDKFELLKNRRTIEKIIKLYKDDFNCFGYSENPFDVFMSAPIKQVKYIPEEILKLNKHKQDHLVDMYRKAAILLQDIEPKLAFKLIGRAHLIRPHGPVIKELFNRMKQSKLI